MATSITNTTQHKIIIMMNLHLKISLAVIIVISIYIQIFQYQNIYNIIIPSSDVVVGNFEDYEAAVQVSLPTTTPTTTTTMKKKQNKKPYRKIQILINNNTNTTPILSFIRIPKTGSTSMMNFLEKYSGLINLPYGFGEGKQTDCMFTNVTMQNMNKKKKAGCAHHKRPMLQHEWDRIHHKYYLKYHIQHFSMIREPYNHMKSWFYYKKQNLKETKRKNYNDEQWEHLTSGNFTGWLHNFHYVGLDKFSSFQYEFFADNVDDAITYFQNLTQHNLPIIIPLINECYTGSMRYMEKIFGGGGQSKSKSKSNNNNYYYFRENAIDDFLNSTQFHGRKTNYNNKKVNNKSKETNVMSLEEENVLRQKAKIWFQDEYKFYNTIVTIFKDLVLKSKIDLSKLPEGSCNILLS